MVADVRRLMWRNLRGDEIGDHDAQYSCVGIGTSAPLPFKFVQTAKLTSRFSESHSHGECDPPICAQQNLIPRFSTPPFARVPADFVIVSTLAAPPIAAAGKE